VSIPALVAARMTSMRPPTRSLLFTRAAVDAVATQVNFG
jgi:hypothetical protein